MKVKDLLDLLKTNYVEIINADDEFNIDYLTKDEVAPQVLNSDVKSIEPITFLRKELFDPTAVEGEYVAAIKVIFDLNNSSQVAEEVPIEEAAYSTFEETQEEEGKDIFGISYRDLIEMLEKSGMPQIPPEVMTSVLTDLMSPDMFNTLTNSDLFHFMGNSEDIMDIINSKDFQNFVEEMTRNGNIPNIFMNFENPFDFNKKSDDSDDKYKDYDLYDEVEPEDDDY